MPILVQRLIDQHICVYAQPVFWKADQAVVESRVGKEKAATSYAFGTLKRGTHLSMGTDCPIEDCDVFENAYVGPAYARCADDGRNSIGRNRR